MLLTCCHSEILVLAARGRQSMAPVSWQHASHGFGREVVRLVMTFVHHEARKFLTAFHYSLLKRCSR